MNSSISIRSPRCLNLYFQIHQPRRLRKFQFFDIGSDTPYFDDDLNRTILERIAHNCYLPTNRVLLKLVKKYPNVRITFSLSGTAIDQLQQYAPTVLESFKQLAATGAVEFLGETYYHSLSYFTDKEEFISQVEKHRQKVSSLFGVHPVVFRNTELIYSDAIGRTVSELGFKGIYLDGIEGVLNGRPINQLYKHPEADLVLLPRNYSLSDDIAFRYCDKNWREWPLTPEKFISWMKYIPANDNFTCIGIDYETFGEHQKANGGIFKFLENVISKVSNEGTFRFVTSSEAINTLSSVEVISAPKAISWADDARDLSAWLGNDMQRDAFDSLNKLYPTVLDAGNQQLMNCYRHLQTSDHFYYMFTKAGNDGNVHQYFSPYKSPYEAFINFMNILADLELKIRNLPGVNRIQSANYEGALQPA